MAKYDQVPNKNISLLTPFLPLNGAYIDLQNIFLSNRTDCGMRPNRI